MNDDKLHPEGGSVEDVLAFAKDRGCTMLDIRFMDLPGLWQHYSLPIRKLEADLFEEGLPFDGSSLRGWKTINESDMIVVPDAETAFLDPFMKEKTLVLIGNI